MTEDNGQTDGNFITAEELFRETPDEAVARVSSDTPIRVELHGELFDILELTLRKAASWEKRAVEFFEKAGEAEGLAVMKEGTDEARTKAMGILPSLVHIMPNQVSDLVIEYMDLSEDKREWVMDNCRRSEIMRLARIVFWLGLPMLRGEGLSGIMPSTVQAEINAALKAEKNKVPDPKKKV